MKIYINGTLKEIRPQTLEELLSHLAEEREIAFSLPVATALNQHFIPLTKRKETLLKEGDRVEILIPREGG